MILAVQREKDDLADAEMRWDTLKSGLGALPQCVWDESLSES